MNRTILFNKIGIHKIGILSILLLGGSLRLFQLGNDSLWLDEAGVAMAVLKPTLPATFRAIQQHAMAMPMDYLIVKLFSSIGISEFWLRLPSAIWGTLTIWVCYLLFKRFSSERVALFAALFLATFPLHIRYSQELRFYASMVFFYTLTTLLLVIAISSNRIRDWIWVTCAAVIGAYFHIYVILAFLNGAAFLFARSKDAQPVCHRWISFLVSALITGLLVLPGFLIFGGRETFHLPLLQYYSSIFEVIVLAFGWVPSRYVNIMVGGFLFGPLMFGLEAIGVIASLRSRKWALLFWMISAALQGVFVISSDYLKGYWVFYRQFLFLLPLSLYFAAVGAEWLWGWLRSRLAGDQPQTMIRWLPAALIIVFLTTNVLAVSEYYRWQKSGARQISATLLQKWHPGDTVFLYPSGDQVIYQFYLGKIFNQPAVLASLEPGDLSSLKPPASINQNQFLIAAFTRQQSMPQEIARDGFKQIAMFDIVNFGKQFLYDRTNP